MTLKLFIGVSAAALIISLAIFFLGVTQGFAASCSGQTVAASWYGRESCANPRNCRTANGERYTGNDFTAAHRTLPFGTKLRVSYRGKSVVVRVNDRGPFVRGRSLDLSKAAAQRIGMIQAGVGKVCFTRL
jgi:rare lipoprotein A